MIRAERTKDIYRLSLCGNWLRDRKPAYAASSNTGRLIDLRWLYGE